MSLRLKRPLTYVLVIVMLSTLSCAGMLDAPTRPHLPSAARLLFYLHTVGDESREIEFAITGFVLESDVGSSSIALPEPVMVNSKELRGQQLFLGEAYVEPGSYSSVKIIVSDASIKNGTKRASLMLSDPTGELSLPLVLNLEKVESHVLSLEWRPDKSLEKGVVFSPSIHLETQRASARELLLFVSNSGSNYISVIDRDLERVVAAVTVGEGPMGMVLNAARDTLFVVNSRSMTVSMVDIRYLTIEDTIPLSVGLEPVDVALIPEAAFSRDGKLYIANRFSNDVTVVDTDSRAVLKVIPAGDTPSHIVSNPTRNEVYVASKMSNELVVISALDDIVVAKIAVGSRPTGVVLDEDRLLVLNEHSNSISEVSPATREVVRRETVADSPKRGLIGNDDRLFIVSNSAETVTFFDDHIIATKTISVSGSPVNLAFDELRNRLYVVGNSSRTLSLVDTVVEEKIKELIVGKGPYGVVLLER